VDRQLCGTVAAGTRYYTTEFFNRNKEYRGPDHRKTGLYKSEKKWYFQFHFSPEGMAVNAAAACIISIGRSGEQSSLTRKRRIGKAIKADMTPRTSESLSLPVF
jgi:hypothetical protein